MSNLPLGKLLGSDAKRDATHVAVAPVIAHATLNPGEHVGVNCGKTSRAHVRVGIIDPFLTELVKPGERVWLFMYPKTITDLRHDWSHPSFPVEAEPTSELKQRVEELEGELQSARDLLANYDPCCP